MTPNDWHHHDVAETFARLQTHLVRGVDVARRLTDSVR